MQAMAEPWAHREAIINGIRLHYVEAGPDDAPLVVLLHGFPEFWYAWRRQIPALAAAGHHVVAPDMRGYNMSEKPPGVRSYAIDALVTDVAGLIAHTGATRATVVGHDWGGVVAWEAAIRRPDVVERLVILNAPHPGALLRAFRRNPRQLLRSWYAFAFQLPVLPELLFALGDYRVLRRVLRVQPARPGAFTDEDIQRYRDAFAVPGARTATINYYRAALRRDPRAVMAAITPVAAPTLLIWGLDDPYLGPELTEGLETWVPRLHVARLPGVSHWVQHDAPERVNALLRDFLRAAPG